MTAPNIREVTDMPTPETARPTLRVADWIWCPFRAKLWWFAIIIYWPLFLIGSAMPWAAGFYRSAWSDYLSLAFHPFTALVVLGAGFAITWWRQATPADPEDVRIGRDWRPHGNIPPEINPLDVRSGPLWILDHHNRNRLEDFNP